MPPPVLSRLHKTTLLRAQRIAKGLTRTRLTPALNPPLPLEDAARLLAAAHPLTPNAAYEVTIQIKPNPTLQLNALRGRVFLPHNCTSSSKSSLLVVFAQGAQAEQARLAGADRVGSEDLIKEILNGTLVPDKLISTPELLSLFQRNANLAKLLGPRGLMPSVKRGTVAVDMTQAVKEARGGLDWRGDGKGVVRAGQSSPDAFARRVDLRFQADALMQRLEGCISRPMRCRIMCTRSWRPSPTLHKAERG